MSTEQPRPAGPAPLPPVGFYRRFLYNYATIAECGGPCAAGGPEACDCGTLWEDLPWDGPSTAAVAQTVAVRAWSRVLAFLDDRIAELQRQRDAHLAQRDAWLDDASAGWDADDQASVEAAGFAQHIVNRAWRRVLASLDDRIAELQRQRAAHMAQRDAWIAQSIAESEPPQPPA